MLQLQSMAISCTVVSTFNGVQLLPIPFFRYPVHSSQHYRNCKKWLVVRASAGENDNGSKHISWKSIASSVRMNSKEFLSSMSDSLIKESGFDIEHTNAKVTQIINAVNDMCKKAKLAFTTAKVELMPEFLAWHRLDTWKNLRKLEPQKFGLLVIYILFVSILSRKFYSTCRSLYSLQRINKFADAYLNEVMPDPSSTNVSKFKQSVWENSVPKGLRIRKLVDGPHGLVFEDDILQSKSLHEDNSDTCHEMLNNIIEGDSKLNPSQKQKVKEGLGVAGTVGEKRSAWQERLQNWILTLERERIMEQMDITNAKYFVEFDMEEVKKSLYKELDGGFLNTKSRRASWIASRWWLYRPRLPYLYFLDKLVCSEVAAVVFSDDFRRLYVTMKEGFPLEYIVDIPLDPHLFEAIIISRVEVDFLHKSWAHYFLQAILAPLPGVLLLWFIAVSMLFLFQLSSRLSSKRMAQFHDVATGKNIVIAELSPDSKKSVYKEAVLDSYAWDLLEHLMAYLRDPMLFYGKELHFIRGVLLFGPPGTGKTLFARTLAKASGVPLVFASGSEFIGTEGNAKKLHKLFVFARKHAPSVLFVDEIDAIAGRNARADRQRRETFDALISELDGDERSIGVDRFSLRQAVIFLCATNRPDELDSEFVRPGRIDIQLHIGLPSSEQRVQMFDVHSAGKKLAEDVNFWKLAPRTIGYSGADIRNLVNEAAILSVRKGHSLVTQQDIVDVLDQQLFEDAVPKEEEESIQKSVPLEKKRLLATHEAGHILLAHLFPHFDWHAFSLLLPGGKETSLSIFRPCDDMYDRSYVTYGYMMMQMVVAHGGRCAERIVFGDVSNEGQNDLQKITKIAREMVVSPSNSRFGLAQLTERSGEAVCYDSNDHASIEHMWDRPRVLASGMSLELSELFARELTRYIDEAEAMALMGLKQNKHILDMIAEILLSKLRVTGLEMEELMKDLSPVMLEDLMMSDMLDMDQAEPVLDEKQTAYQRLDIFSAPLHRC